MRLRGVHPPDTDTRVDCLDRGQVGSLELALSQQSPDHHIDGSASTEVRSSREVCQSRQRSDRSQRSGSTELWCLTWD